MRLYNFKRLISKYSVDFTLLKTTSGSFVSGKWVEGEANEIKMRGAIVPLSERKLYSYGGTYSTQDRELYLSEPLGSPLSAFKVVYNTNTYTIEESRNFDEFAGCAVYVLKWVSTNEQLQND